MRLPRRHRAPREFAAVGVDGVRPQALDDLSSAARQTPPSGGKLSQNRARMRVSTLAKNMHGLRTWHCMLGSGCPRVDDRVRGARSRARPCEDRAWLPRALIGLLLSTVAPALAPPGFLDANLSSPQDPARPPGQRDAPAPEESDAADHVPTEASKRWLRGQLDTRYHSRWTNGADDHDLYGTLTLDLGDEDRDRITGHFMGKLAWDVDGAESTASSFYSLNDTKNGDVTAYVYDAYADVHRVPGFSLLRAGRQSAYETPEFVFFDGLRAESTELGAMRYKLGAYGGLSTHLFEASARDDWTLGGLVRFSGALTRGENDDVPGDTVDLGGTTHQIALMFSVVYH